jgi:hypothetical protein
MTFEEWYKTVGWDYIQNLIDTMYEPDDYTDMQTLGKLIAKEAWEKAQL